MTESLPNLESLVLDADVNVLVRRYLVAVGFDAVLATHVGADIRSDLALLQWATSNERILVCHDKHRCHTRMQLTEEICERGGRIIRIGGRPDQHPVTSAGMIMVHRAKWLEFFQEEGDGIAIVHPSGFKVMTQANLQEQYQRRVNPEINPLSRLEQRSRGSTEPPA